MKQNYMQNRRTQSKISLIITSLFASLLTAIVLPHSANAGDFWSSCDSGLANTSSAYVTIDSTVSGKCIITFKQTQTFTLPAGVTTITEALVVGGGGGGGFGNNGGGGGAGLVQHRDTSFSLMPTTQTVPTTQLVITIGSGGDDGWLGIGNWAKGSNGNPTTIATQSGTVIIRAGGGGGGCGNTGVNTGYEGSAGGACSYDTAAKSAGSVTATTGWTKYANAGASGAAAGGGGAGSAGSGHNGGNGVTLFGLNVGGGGGGWYGGSTGATTWGGGSAITGNYSVANADTNTGSDGSANTGGGGGAARKGGSGVVKIAYSIPSAKAPSAPTSVSATAGAGSLNVSWSSPTDTGLSTITGYQVEYSTTGSGTWTIASSSVGASTYSYSITNLEGLTSYFVRVAARYSGGIGAYGYPWVEIYRTITPYRSSGLITYVSGYGLSGGAAATYASSDFSRIRYRMASTYDGTAKYVDADFYRTLGTKTSTSTTFDSISKLQVPTTSGTGSQFVIQADVTDLNILTNATEVQSGAGLSGRLELWPWNYGVDPASPLASRTPGTYDDSDTHAGSSSYGSFQLHNLSSSPKETVFAWNNHQDTTNYNIGFGNHQGTNSDWTHCQNAAPYCSGRTYFSLSIFINPPKTTLAGLTLAAPTSGLTGTAMTAYSLNIPAATGGSGSYSYSLSAGSSSLPPGLSLFNGTIVGTPTTAGTYSGIRITATDTSTLVTGQSAAFTITINSGTQLPLRVATRFGTVGQQLYLGTGGGSGNGNTTYSYRNGPNTTCVLSGSTLVATTSGGATGICFVTATKGADTAFTSSVSPEATIVFTPYVPVITQGTTCSQTNSGTNATGIGTNGCQPLAPVAPTAPVGTGAPKITALSATSGLVGASITITGTGFGTVTKVQFGSKSTTTFTATATTISVAVPTGATTGRVMVFSPTGTAMASGIFTVISTDTRAPAFLSGNVNTSSPTQITLSFDETLKNSGLLANAFGVSVASTSRQIDSIAISGTTITITLASAVTTGQSVVFTYTSPDDTTSIQDVAGNKTATITATAISNTL